MILIFGGAYQGKLDFAREKFNVSDGDVMRVKDETAIESDKKCINGYHALVLSQLRAGIGPLEYLAENIENLKDKIIICDDVSSGVVPIDYETRAWREACGRCATLLSKRADEVWRVFCGIGTKLK